MAIDPAAITIVVHHGLKVHEAAREAYLYRTSAPAAKMPRLRRFAVWLCSLLPVTRRWPGVSVVTPTWQRHKLLTTRCVPSVRHQQYQGEVEHVIISDGPDPELQGFPGVGMLPDHIPERNRGVRARELGTRLAHQDIIAYLDDDNAWRERHLAVVVRALLDSDSDFAYSRALCHDNGFSYSIGIAPPTEAQIDTSCIVHKRGLLELADWQPSPDPADWALVRKWIDGGAKWVFVPEITLDYYVRGTSDA